MSGNERGGASYSPGGAETSCDIWLTTVLASPDPDAVIDLTVDDVLRVALRESPRSVVAERLDGRVVGAITQRAADLARCIQDGSEFIARVTGITGGAVTVDIEPTG